MALLIGIVEAPFTSSTPSATIHSPPSCTPASSSNEMQSRHRWKTPQFLHGEYEFPVHQAVNHQPMLCGVDVRHVRAAGGSDVMQRRRRNDSHRFLQRSRDVKIEAEGVGRMSAAMGYAFRILESRAFAIGDEIVRADDHSLGVRQLPGCRFCRGEAQSTGQCCSALEKLPSIRLSGTHCPLPLERSAYRDFASGTM